ncbi:GNAT family N-acetyltransferase [Rathayibacter soli]|uniref:GNAT family N-acetyltransferase n=1 Tax=Rathayibacter soli TaxID=3144168 RepID=UPI0027E4D973|nr:GNAT family N-acetyltransferase [Glaciibacter superstes]
MTTVRRAFGADANDVARLLRDFNAEFDDVVPERGELSARMKALIDSGETVVLLVGNGPDGLAVLRFRQAIWAAGAESQLAELYVVPRQRGHGLGRALMDAAIEQARARGAVWMDLGTSEADVAARKLYESVGFTNREVGSGAVQYFYGREL